MYYVAMGLRNLKLPASLPAHHIQCIANVNEAIVTQLEWIAGGPASEEFIAVAIGPSPGLHTS